MLLGMLMLGGFVAVSVLKNLGVDLRSMQKELEKIIQPGLGPTESSEALPHTPRARKVIEYAMAEARALKHDYVGTEHELLGLLREENCVAALLLQQHGVTIESVRREVSRLLGE